MIEQLFGSKTRVKLLKLFYGNPNRAFYVREITRKIDEQINSVRRELSNLLNVGIITSDNTNNRLYYEVNQHYQYYEPLLTIFGNRTANAGVEEAEEAESIDDEDVKLLGQVDLILYTGQLTRDSSAPIDVLIVGSVNKNAVEKYISNLETDEGKQLAYTIMKLEDFMYRNQIRDRFLVRVLKSKKQILVDKRSLIEE